MRHHTVSATFSAPANEMFDYLADLENLSEWATEFARELQHVDGRHKAVNGLGEFFFELHADPGSGVIDMLAGPREDTLQLFPTRVVPLADGGSAFTFTMFQAPGQPDEQFERQIPVAPPRIQKPQLAVRLRRRDPSGPRAQRADLTTLLDRAQYSSCQRIHN